MSQQDAYVERYSVTDEGIDAWRFSLDENERIVIEPHVEEDGEHFASFVWTVQEWDEVSGLLSEMLEKGRATGEAEFWNDEEHEEISGRGVRVLEKVLDKDKAPSFLRFDFKRYSVIWCDSWIDDGADAPSFGIMTLDWEPDFIDEIAARTGTPLVRELVEFPADDSLELEAWFSSN